MTLPQAILAFQVMLVVKNLPVIVGDAQDKGSICQLQIGTCQGYIEELYKKDPNDPDNHDGLVTHLDLGILECEVKWALGSITMNKASGRDGIPAELFKIQKDDTVKVLHSICQFFQT